MASYPGDPGLPRVLVTRNLRQTNHLIGGPQIEIQDFGDHFYIEPFEMESEDQFNKLALLAICEAHKLTRQTADNHKDAEYMLLRWDMDIGVSVPDPHNLNDYFLLANKEYFGCVAIRDLSNFDQLYALAIANPRGVVKVTNRSVPTCESHLGPLKF